VIGGRLETPAGRNLGAAGLAWLLVLVAAVTGWWVFQPVLRDATDSDLTLVFIGARIGLEHGWSHIYSLDLQHELFSQLRPGAPFGDGARFLSPPPLALLVLPLTALGLMDAFWIWLVVSIVALAAAWWLSAPGGDLTRSLWLVGALAWYPVLYSLVLGQPTMLVLLAVAACWWLAEAGKPYLAGVVLGLSVVKPQLTIAVPLVLLAAGRWRIAAAWGATVLALAVYSIIAIGDQGFGDYSRLLAEAQAVPNNRYFTLAYYFGPGAVTYALQVAVTAAGVVGAYLNRRAGLARILCLGLVTTALGASYWHLQDFAILVVAVWMFWRDGPPAWQRMWLLVVAIAGEFAWPLGPTPILIALAVWLAFLIVPSRPQENLATAVTS
jgi:alpha-1,2-mannosyltransferase